MESNDSPPSLRAQARSQRQQAGLEALIALAQPVRLISPSVIDLAVKVEGDAVPGNIRPGTVAPVRRHGGRDRLAGGDGPTDLPPGEAPTGPLSHQYPIPLVRFTPRRWLIILPAVIILAGSAYLHREHFETVLTRVPWMAGIWAFTLSMALAQLVLSWWQKPYTVTARQRKALDYARVTVVIPCYNEDPAILDRTIYALSQQTRLPQHVVVVDDGSKKVDYSGIREWWQRGFPGEFTWIRQDNAGKKHAQVAGFSTDSAADIFVTIDSDSALTVQALEEGLKPFAQQEIVSVAGLESAYNFRRNVLTRAVAARSLSFQLFAMSAQSVAGGSVLINPGAFSLYRAWLIRRIIPAYIGETFLGVPVTLGDDTALTTFALCHGKAVHQPTAVALNVYPETLSHHLRQWTRWMRASTIRTLWRIRYLPMHRWGWLYVAYSIWSFLNSIAVTAVIPMSWPAYIAATSDSGISWQR